MNKMRSLIAVFSQHSVVFKPAATVRPKRSAAPKERARDCSGFHSHHQTPNEPSNFGFIAFLIGSLLPKRGSSGETQTGPRDYRE